MASAGLYGLGGRGVFDAGHYGRTIPTGRGDGGVAATERRGFAVGGHALLVHHAPEWQTLIADAYAVTDAAGKERRKDFTLEEMKAGKVLYLEQMDNLSGKAIYRMHIVEASADRLVFDVENVTLMSYFFVTLFHPGEMQSIYYLDRESDDVWRYYSISRTGRNASRLAVGHESSWINRAVAFYRALAGIPTDQEPPAAR